MQLTTPTDYTAGRPFASAGDTTAFAYDLVVRELASTDPSVGPFRTTAAFNGKPVVQKAGHSKGSTIVGAIGKALGGPSSL